MIELEPEVFFDTDDFACSCTRVRTGVADAPFVGILATVDESLFDHQVQAGTHALQYPTAAVQLMAGDTVQTVSTDAAGATLPAQVWRVLRSPQRVVDGQESSVWLFPAA